MQYGEADSSMQKSPSSSGFGAMLSVDETTNGLLAGWRIREAEKTQGGIPTLLQTAVMIRRTSDDPFYVNVKIDVQVSGISFQTAGRAVERVVIDPRVPGIGDLGIDTTHLASTNLDLYQLISDTVTQPVFPDPEQVRVTEREDIEERAAVEAKLDNASTETVLTPNNQPCFYVQLWNSDSLRPRRTPENMRLDVPEFKNLLSEKWPHQPNSDLLAKYFSWLDLNQVSCRLQPIFEEKY
jgi:hypothetical protein